MIGINASKSMVAFIWWFLFWIFTSNNGARPSGTRPHTVKSGLTRLGAWPVFTDGRGNAIRHQEIITPPIGMFTNQGSISKTFPFTKPL